jgi:PAS domain S-box-containing protein
MITIYTVFFLATTLISFFVAFLAWQRKSLKGAKELTYLMIGAGIWTFWVMFETAATTIQGKAFWSGVEYIGAVSVPVLYLIFVLRFTDKEKYITPKYILLLFIIPVITLFLAITNEKHHLIWTGFSPISEKTNIMEYYHGIGFWIGHMAYNYFLFLLATIYLFSFIFNQVRIFRMQGLLVFIAGLCPWIASVFYLTGSNIVSGLNITPASIILSGSLFAFAIFYNYILDLVPVARKMLVETLPYGILVLDSKNRIQDINGVALSFLGIRNKNIIGFPAESSGAYSTDLLKAALDSESVDQIAIQSNNEIKIFSILKYAIENPPGSRLIVIHNITEIKNAELEIIKTKDLAVENEAKYKELFVKMMNAFALHEMIFNEKGEPIDYKFLEVNPAWEKIVGIKAEMVINKTIREIMPEVEDSWIQVYGRVVKTGIPEEFEDYNKATQKYFYVYAYRTEPGKFAVLFNDITERKQAEIGLVAAKEKTEKDEERYRTLYNSNPLMIFTVDADGIILSVNEAGVKQLEYSKEDLLGNSILLLFHDDDKQKVIELKEKCLLNPDKIMSWELRKISKNGKLIYVNEYARVIQANDGSKIILIMCEDITERKRTEKALIQAKEKAEKNEEQFKLLNSLTSEMLLLQDLESTYKFIAKNLQNYNPNTLVLYVSIDESSQQTRLEAISGLDNNLLKKVIKISGFNPIGKTYQLTELHLSIFKSGNFVEFKGGLTEFSASEFPTFATNAIEKLIGLHKIYTIGINKDDELLAAIHFLTFNKQVISDGNFIEVFVKQAGLVLQKIINEKALTIAKQKAEESDRLKSAFLANMSHEIRTPMNGILGFSGLLKEPKLTGEEQQEYIGIIEKSGTRMINIINDIVDISKIEAGLMTLDIKESDINEQIEYIYTFFKPEVEAKGMKLSFINTLPSKEAIISTDREKVFAILTNLVKNAIKYTNKGSIEFGYNKKGDYIEFFVKDTGIGIPRNRQEAIFERFIQADIEDKMARQGAGLGLAITKAYIEMIGGKIWVDSTEGNLPDDKAGGSTFYFTIPYNKATKKETKHDNIDVADELPKLDLKILIVEDDETSSNLLSIILDSFEKEIISVINGYEALEACRNNPDIDLILMDIQIPGMSGYEVTRQIREFNKEVVIIAQTAYGLSGDREKALDAGCNDYISKPIVKDELMSLIQQYFIK